MSNEKEENEVIDLTLHYIETPYGKVATLESVKQLADIVRILNEEINNIREDFSKFSKTGGEDVSSFEERLNRIEKTLEDLVDRVSTILDALQEQARLIAELKKREHSTAGE